MPKPASTSRLPLRAGGFVLLAATLLALAWARPGDAETAASVRIDGRSAPFKAVIINGVAHVPLTRAARAFEAQIEWNPITDTVTVNGAILPAHPQHVKGVVYVPAAKLADMLGLQLGWDRRTRVLTFDHGTAGRPSPTPTRVATPGPRPSAAPRDDGSPFRPVEATDGTFLVSVTNVADLEQVRGYYNPRPGSRFVQVNLSQQNVSDTIQIYTGHFVLADDKGQVYEPLEHLSNFWLVILRPGGINFGYLIFEVPVGSRASRIVLDTRERSPLSVSL